MNECDKFSPENLENSTKFSNGGKMRERASDSIDAESCKRGDEAS
jgi:hypothetical protein